MDTGKASPELTFQPYTASLGSIGPSSDGKDDYIDTMADDYSKSNKRTHEDFVGQNDGKSPNRMAEAITRTAREDPDDGRQSVVGYGEKPKSDEREDGSA